MEITILGCGPSYGIPTVRYGYGSCDPNNPKNARTRSCICIKDKDTTLLFDTPPELRLQLVKNKISSVDAIIFTHMHSDHIMGIDDARVFTYTPSEVREHEVTPLPIYIHESDFDEFKTRFPFYLKPMTYIGQEKPPFIAHLIKPYQEFTIKNLTLLPILQDHMTCRTLGFKIGNFAYNTDLIDFIDYDLENLKGIDLWILDCVNEHPNKKHLYLEKALQWFEIVKPKRLVLTHLGAKIDYDTISAKLPKGVELAYDGMKLFL